MQTLTLFSLLSFFPLLFLGVFHASPVYDSGGIFLSLPPGGSVIVSNITVSNVDSLNITALQLQTFISGTLNGNYSITLISPSDTHVFLSRSLVSISNIFNGTIWSDESVKLAESRYFVDGFTPPCAATSGAPECFGWWRTRSEWQLESENSGRAVCLQLMSYFGSKF